MTTLIKSADPRVKRTRKLLQQAFMELFQEKSFASISIQDITERATVNRATFYAHFEDKYALLDSIIREQFQHALVSKLPPLPRWGKRTLRALIGTVLEYFREMHTHCKPGDRQFDPLIERAAQQELYELLLTWLRLAPASRTASRVPVETIATVVSWAIFGAAVQWSHETNAISAEQMTDHVLAVITEGVAHLPPTLSLE